MASWIWLLAGLACNKGGSLIAMDTGGATSDCIVLDEICDGMDNDCDGAVDEGLTIRTYADEDGDGFGDPEVVHETCSAPEGTVEDGTDCDDADNKVNPGKNEICDGIDNNCDGAVDEDLPLHVWYMDLDDDGYGAPETAVEVCRAPDGAVDQPGDCDDDNPDVHPHVDEVCDGLDQDCNGYVDEDVTQPFYADNDGDGFGLADEIQHACAVPPDYAETSGDCDDDDPLVHPDAVEVCDEIDNDCDGVADESDCETPHLYIHDFDHGVWGDWTDLIFGTYAGPLEGWGTSSAEWSFEDGALCERSEMANALALSPDQGVVEAYDLRVDVRISGVENRAVGLVFGYTDLLSMRMLLWINPTGYYDEIDGLPTDGRVRLVERGESGWITIAENDSTVDVLTEAEVWSTLQVDVVDAEVTALLDGTVLFDGTTTLDTGPLSVGVWSFDNDGGVCFDNVVITPL